MPTEFSIGLQIYLYVLIFFFGACIASFVTCAADRYAAKLSVLKGRSFCPACGHKLGVLDLFPVFSYLFLRGKCRYCGAKIPVRCLLTELLGGAGYLMIVFRYGLSWTALELALAAPALLAIALIDTDTTEIPDGLVLWLVVVWAAFVATYPDPYRRLVDAAIGGAALGGGLLLISLVMDKVLGKESLGGGDVKLFFAVGLSLGPWRGLLTVLLACVCGLVPALLNPPKNGQFPFGPAIVLATFVVLLVGSDVIDWYLSLFV